MKLSFGTVFQPTVLLALALMAVIAMMILPMPSSVLDIGLAASFALAILIFTITLFIERPLDFSAFPTILLASLMLRLSLNISSTKLIVGQGHTGTSAAGGVIEGFALFIMGGSVYLGLVVFGVLLIVNFIVITKGAARMAEVGARFALDAMPGKQLAIDSDVSAGAIDHAEAKNRRELEQAETTFFGSLDGASKFVKGDAVAGLLITLLNMVMGLAIGTFAHGMPISTAFETYSILTVGDGLVSQIPAVIISIASALLLARGGARGKTDVAMFQQLGKHPAALGTVGVLMAFFALVPGLPFLPFILGSIGLGVWSFMNARNRTTDPESEVSKLAEAEPEAEKTLGDILDLDDIHVSFAPDLVSMVLDQTTGLDARIESLRTHVATEYGLLLSDIRLTDDLALGKGDYVIKIQGVEAGRGSLRPDLVLALLPEGENTLPAGEDVEEPVYQVPARWLDPDDRDRAALEGVTTVSATEVLATHLLEVTKQNLGRLLTLKSLRKLLDEMRSLSDEERASENRRLLDDLVPDKVSIESLLSVLRLLLDEEVSIRNMPTILETMAELRGQALPVEMQCEIVRQRLNLQLLQGIKRPDGTVPLIQLDQAWEAIFVQHELQGTGQSEVALPPDMFQKLTTAAAERLARANEGGTFPAFITSARRRRYIKTLLKAKGIVAPVLSFEELGTAAKPSLLGVIAP